MFCVRRKVCASSSSVCGPSSFSFGTRFDAKETKVLCRYPGSVGHIPYSRVLKPPHLRAPMRKNMPYRSAFTFPSVTVLLSATADEESRSRLENWQERMIAQMGLEPFNKWMHGGLVGVPGGWMMVMMIVNVQLSCEAVDTNLCTAL